MPRMFGARSPRLVAMVAALLVMSACSGIPRSSRPETIRPVGGQSTVVAADLGPVVGQDPRQVVLGFLNAAAHAPGAHHSSARQFLTADTGGKWLDTTATILSDDSVSQGDIRGGVATVDVFGDVTGSLDSKGVYTPVNKPAGVSFNFVLRRVDNSWRISKLPENAPGVLITRVDFTQYYQNHPLYFFNAAQTQLVPDLRYSPLLGDELADWLLAQLVTGARQSLAPSVKNEIPPEVDATRHASVKVATSGRIVFEVPGAAQLDPGTLTRLAIQLAVTYALTAGFPTLALTDGGKALSIPRLGESFSPSDFPDFGPDSQSSTVAERYFLVGNKLVSGSGDKPVSGPVGKGIYLLESMALRQVSQTDTEIAAVGPSSDEAGAPADRLVTGRVSGPLTPATGLQKGQPLTRPEFVPGSPAVWVGSGASIYQVGTDRRAKLVFPAGALGGGANQVVALRFSPDGTRLALVLKNPGGESWISVGSAVRTGQQTTVSASTFTTITQANLKVFDVAWKNATTLMMIAGPSSAQPQVWSVQSDGWNPQPDAFANTPPAIKAVEAYPGQPLVVTRPPAVWNQLAGAWTKLAGAGAAASAVAYALPAG